MFRFKKVIGVAALVAIVAAMGISTVASAQSSTTPTPVPNAQTVPPNAGGGPGGRGVGLRGQTELAAAAKALGMTTDELSTQLWGGKTLADIATAKGVDIATVKAAVDAAQIAETKTAIAQAVTAGTITQAKADWLLAGLNAGYWGAGVAGDFGFGMGPMGGPGGHGGHGGPNGTAPNGAAPSSTVPATPTLN